MSSIGTENLKGKIREIFILGLEAMLEKYTRGILLSEEKYGMSFGEFEKLWDEGRISNKHSYEIESDFIDWEMLEMEKRDLLKWHYHPVDNPEEHISCDEPTVDKVISDMKKILADKSVQN